MARPVTLYTLQWGDLSLETVCQKAKEFGYDGVELGLPDHVDVRRIDSDISEKICWKSPDTPSTYGFMRSLPIWLDKLFAIISMSVIRQSCRITFGEMAIRKGFTNGLPRR